MAPKRSGNRILALKLWVKSKGTMTPKEIGDSLGVSNAQIRQWKHLDNWDNVPLKRPRGAQKGNQNAVGNNGGAPEGNQNAVKHGFYSRYLPETILEIVKEIEDDDPLNMLWDNIILIQAKLLHGQKIIHVKDKDDETKVLTKHAEGKFGDTLQWEYQHAHDKFAAAAKADVLMMRELRSAIKQFFAAAPENDERRLKLELMQVQIAKTNIEVEKIKRENPPEINDGIDAMSEEELRERVEATIKSIGELQSKMPR